MENATHSPERDVVTPLHVTNILGLWQASSEISGLPPNAFVLGTHWHWTIISVAPEGPLYAAHNLNLFIMNYYNNICSTLFSYSGQTHLLFVSNIY